MNYTMLFVVLLGIFSCQGQSNREYPKDRQTAVSPDDNCAPYKTLSGEYDHVINDGGSIIWNGELTGTIEFQGANFNEMVCTYTVTDCTNGGITMICDGSKFETRIILEDDGGVVLNHSKFFKRS